MNLLQSGCLHLSSGESASHISLVASASFCFKQDCQGIAFALLMSDTIVFHLLTNSSTASTFPPPSVTVTRVVPHNPSSSSMQHLRLNATFSVSFCQWVWQTHLRLHKSHKITQAPESTINHTKSVSFPGLIAAIVLRIVMTMYAFGSAS